MDEDELTVDDFDSMMSEKSHNESFRKTTVVSHIYAYDRAKTLSFILLIRRKSTEFENESNV